MNAGEAKVPLFPFWKWSLMTWVCGREIMGLKSEIKDKLLWVQEGVGKLKCEHWTVILA